MSFLDNIPEDSPLIALQSRKVQLAIGLFLFSILAGIILLITSGSKVTEDVYIPKPHPDYPKLITVGRRVENSYIVVLNENVPQEDAIRDLNRTFNGTLKTVDPGNHSFTLTITEDRAQEMSKDQRIKYISEIAIVVPKNKKK